jgi:protein-tyrosine phosphatase
MVARRITQGSSWRGASPGYSREQPIEPAIPVGTLNGMAGQPVHKRDTSVAGATLYTSNFRDFGGYPAAGGAIRPGVLMRSAALVDLGVSSQQALRSLGLRTAIDLREPVERDLDPAVLGDSGAELREWPLIAGAIDLTSEISLPELYAEVIERCGDRLAGAVRLLAAPGALPAVFFCSAGKDRTGIVSALLLSSLGVDDETVAGDYALTEAMMQGELRRQVAARARAAGLGEQALAVKLGAPRELILGVLAGVRRTDGGAARYLERHGLERGELEALRLAVVDRERDGRVATDPPSP